MDDNSLNSNIRSSFGVIVKVARYSHNSKVSYGIIEGKWIVNTLTIAKKLGSRLPPNPTELCAEDTKRKIVEAISKLSTRIPLAKVRLLAPISQPHKIICLGMNYAEHAAEGQREIPKDPVIFMKPRTAIIGPSDDILCPTFVTQLDYEGELAFVIGKISKNVKAKDALNHVAGYMILNDVSARDIQSGDKQWTRGKSFDTFAPTGPWLVSSDEVDDPQNLMITTKVNGEKRQNTSTAKMVNSVSDLIVKLSKVMTMEPGDIISTGTPSGVGIFWKPKPKLLKHGDKVEITISKIGAITNRVRFMKEVGPIGPPAQETANYQRNL